MNKLKTSNRILFTFLSVVFLIVTFAIIKSGKAYKNSMALNAEALEVVFSGSFDTLVLEGDFQVMLNSAASSKVLVRKGHNFKNEYNILSSGKTITIKSNVGVGKSVLAIETDCLKKLVVKNSVSFKSQDLKVDDLLIINESSVMNFDKLAAKAISYKGADGTNLHIANLQVENFNVDVTDNAYMGIKLADIKHLSGWLKGGSQLRYSGRATQINLAIDEEARLSKY